MKLKRIYEFNDNIDGLIEFLSKYNTVVTYYKISSSSKTDVKLNEQFKLDVSGSNVALKLPLNQHINIPKTQIVNWEVDKKYPNTVSISTNFYVINIKLK